MILYTTEVEIAGLVLRDPVTAITNVMIFALSLFCYLKLNKRDMDYPHKNWNYFFLLIGVSSLVGVVVHGFSYYTSPQVHFHIWWLMGIIQGAGFSIAQFGVGSNVFLKRKSIVGIVVIIQFLAFATSMYVTESYEIAKLHIGLSLVPIMIYYVFLGMKGLKAEIFVATGIGVSALTGVIHALKISFSQWFNYNDIAHVFILASITLMYKGIKAGLVEKKFAEDNSPAITSQ